MPEESKKEQNGFGISPSSICKPSGIQRVIRKYNEYHSLLFYYCLYYVLLGWCIIFNIPHNEMEK